MDAMSMMTTLAIASPRRPKPACRSIGRCRTRPTTRAAAPMSVQVTVRAVCACLASSSTAVEPPTWRWKRSTTAMDTAYTSSDPGRHLEPRPPPGEHGVPRGEVRPEGEGSERERPQGEERCALLGVVSTTHSRSGRATIPKATTGAADPQDRGEARVRNAAPAVPARRRQGDDRQRDPEHDHHVGVDLERDDPGGRDDRGDDGDPPERHRRQPAGRGEGRPGEQRRDEGTLVAERRRRRRDLTPAGGIEERGHRVQGRGRPRDGPAGGGGQIERDEARHRREALVVRQPGQPAVDHDPCGQQHGQQRDEVDARAPGRRAPTRSAGCPGRRGRTGASGPARACPRPPVPRRPPRATGRPG